MRPTSACAEDAQTSDVTPSYRGRAARELLLEAVFRPLARPLIPPLRRAGVPPPAVVLANVVAGLLAAVALVRGELVTAALLIQLKSLLDNTDGGLARASGRVTLLGRYLDTEADLAVNAVLFAALGYVTGSSWLALLAFVALTLVLAADFNATSLYREAYGVTAESPPVTGGRLESLLARAYDVVFGTLDRGLRAIALARLERALGLEPDPERRRRATLAYHDRFTVSVLANFGLTTQLAVLGICLVLGVPGLYLWFVLACLAVVPVLQLRRERLARRALRSSLR